MSGPQLSSLAATVRQHLGIGDGLTEGALVASLGAILAHDDKRLRWRTAFGSELGQWLIGRGCDLNTALGMLLAILPARQS